MSFDFNLALSGMRAAQQGLKVTQHNITNIHTEGYARQRLELKENGAASGGGIMKKNGSGVRIQDVKMMVDQILLNNYNGQNSKVGYFENIQVTLTELETVYGDFTNGSLNKLTTNFFEAWEELSKFPEETSYKHALLGEAKKLTFKINELSHEFSRIREFTMEKADRQMEQINTLTADLARINQKFNELGGDAPNSLRNERNRVVEELSRYMEIDTKFEHTNPDVVSIRSGGALLVDGESSFPLSVVRTEDETFLNNGSARIELGNGELKASFDLIDTYITGYEKHLENFAHNLQDKINTYHANGYSIAGDTGINFFTGTGASTLNVNSVLLDDATKIATSSVPGVAGNTDVSKQIANAIYEDVTPGVNFRGYINSLTVKMSQDLYDAKMQTNIQYEVLTGMQEQRDSIQGVNMEEEMTALMMYQKFFGANAKSLQILDEMYDMVFQII